MKKIKRTDKPQNPRPKRKSRVLLSSWYEPKTLYYTTMDEVEDKITKK